VEIEPLMGWVIVKHVEEEQKGLIVRPANAREDTVWKGEVVAASAERMLESGTKVPMRVKKGDTVVYNKFTRAWFMEEGVEHTPLKEDEVIAIIEK